MEGGRERFLGNWGPQNSRWGGVCVWCVRVKLGKMNEAGGKEAEK
jgi:hypothetical protein